MVLIIAQNVDFFQVKTRLKPLFLKVFCLVFSMVFNLIILLDFWALTAFFWYFTDGSLVDLGGLR